MTLHLPRFLSHSLAALVLAFGGFAFAAPPQLLLPHQATEAKAEERKPFKGQGHRVDFNMRALRAMKPGEQTELALPNGKRHPVHVDLIEEHGGGDTTFHGHIKGDKGDKYRVVITHGAAGSFGRIMTPEGDFRLIPGEGHDWLVDMLAEQEHLPLMDLRRDVRVPPEVPKASFSTSSPDVQTVIPGVNSVGVGAATPTPQVFVDLLIVYTPNYANNLGSGLTTRLNNLIASMNTMLADSEVAITLRLAHHAAVAGSSDAGDDGAALDAITPAQGGPVAPFLGVENLRNQHGADMVMFLRNGSDFGGSGVAWIANAAMGPGFAPYMYSVVTGCVRGCEWVLMHELGHNMGNMHDRATSQWEASESGFSITGSYSYSYGYYACSPNTLDCNPAVPGSCGNLQPECSSFSGSNISDIMAYFHGSTTRNFKFSNPLLANCRGSNGVNQACGIAEGASNSADAARSMNNNRTALSALRTPPAPSASSTTVVATSQNPSYVGQAVTFTATVSGASGTPTGTVNFRDGGATISGCGTAALSAGRATCTTSGLAQGTRTITAVYSGNSTYVGSTSAGLSQGVAVRVTPTVSLSSSANPANVGVSVTFTASVSGSQGTATGTVTFRDNGSPVSGCSSVALSGGSASCTTSAIPAGTHAMTALYNGNVAYNTATSSELSQVIAVANNVALASAGAVATASSNGGAGFPVSSVIDNMRSGLNWGNGGGWQDATYNSYPDWVQVQFNGNKLIDRVVVYTLSNSYGTEPTDSTPAGTYGVQNFTVEGWTGSSWQVLGTVTGNTLAKRTVTFSGVIISRIRVNVTAAAYFHSRIVEIEAFGTDAGPTAPPPGNVALASTGAVATASSTAGGGYPVTAVNDNLRTGANWGSGGGWEDATYNAYPDWVQIQFNGTKTITSAVVYTLSNSYGTEPTDSTSASNYGLQGFTVEGWTGSAWQVLGTVGGNTLAKRTVTFAEFTTDRIRVNVSAAAYYKSRIVEIEVFGVAAEGAPMPSNWALASAGGVATASSTAGGGYPVSALNDNQRSGANWGSGGGWEDASYNAYPDWAQIQFNGAKAIDRVVVYTLSNSYGTEPTESTSASVYGIQNFTVEGWTGSAWQVLATVTDNTLAMRSVTFAAFTTDRIRVNVTSAAYFKSRIIEIEAWGVASSAPVATNVALASAGATATASSVAGAGYPVAAVNDDLRTGAGWGSGGGWEDATYNAYPDWVQIQFNGTKTVTSVVVYTLSNSYGTEPSDSTSASTYGIQSFTVEGWTGSAWQVLGTVTGNTLAKRTVTFDGFSTDRIRVNVTGAAYYKSRIVEIEAWGT